MASTQTQIQLSEGSLFRELEKPSLPVWALINRSWKLMYEMTADSLPEAVRLAEEAVSLDPGSGRAHQALASALFHWFWMGFVDDGEPVVSRGRNMAERAVRLNANDEYSHWILGMFKLLDGEFDKAISEMERAIEVNPNCSLAYGSLATVLNYAGDPERSVANNEIAIRSNPRDPSIFYRYTGLALSHYLLNQLDSAIEWARKSTQFKPEFFQGYAVLIASLIEKDCPEEAQSALQDCLQHSPKAALSEVTKLPFRHSSHRQRLTDALREAGLPE
ncbi:MAG: tetratricopeptide repeat protein [Rhizobiales bacterium]|nr:tetratricopeptide repeat protein [Hyphomicrobiales bacterium]